MKLDQYKNPILTVDEGKKALLYGNDIDGVFIEDDEEVTLFNENSERILGEEIEIKNPLQDLEAGDFESYHSKKASNWDIPQSYQKMDVKSYILDKCLTEEEADRVEMEYRMFEERDLIPLLRFLIYLVDHMRENRIVWGVGRGSSVASYCLYLIGIHKVNSIRYELPIEEFLK